jgi:hypothetical protein
MSEPVVDQQDGQRRKVPGRPFVRGQSGNTAGKRSGRWLQLHDRIMADFAGIPLTGYDTALIELAISLMVKADRVANPDRAARATNSACRLLDKVRAKPRPKSPRVPTLASIVGGP